MFAYVLCYKISIIKADSNKYKDFNAISVYYHQEALVH